MPSTRPRAFLDITIDAGPARRIEIELYNDHTPKTCKK